jgi:hypothetical protein
MLTGSYLRLLVEKRTADLEEWCFQVGVCFVPVFFLASPYMTRVWVDSGVSQCRSNTLRPRAGDRGGGGGRGCQASPSGRTASPWSLPRLPANTYHLPPTQHPP